jgi:hypothetical protein
MTVMLTGNRDKDLAHHIVQRFEQEGHSCHCFSRANGYDFEDNPTGVIARIVKQADQADVFINLYANYFFNSSVLAHKLFNRWLEKGWSHKRIINIGSTTDRVQRGKRNLYHYEKRILREMSSGHSMLSVWDQAPKVTHFSFGTMENRADSNPGRRCLSMPLVADYVYWLTQQPAEIHINELSIDPVQ